MNKPLLEAFNINCIEVYNKLLNSVVSERSILDITHNTSKDTFLQLALNILNSNMRRPKITLKDGPYKVEHEQLELHNSIAEKLIGSGFTFSISKNTSTIVHITYIIPFDGDTNAIRYTANLNKRLLPIELKNDKIVLHFFTQRTIEEVAEHVKAERDSIVAMINNNQKEVDEFWESKKSELLTHINNEIDKKYKEEIRKNELNNLLS